MFDFFVSFEKRGRAAVRVNCVPNFSQSPKKTISEHRPLSPFFDGPVFTVVRLTAALARLNPFTKMPSSQIPTRPKPACRQYRRPPDYHVLGVLGALVLFGGLLLLGLLLFLSLWFLLGLSSTAATAMPDLSTATASSGTPLTTNSPTDPTDPADPALSANSHHSRRHAYAQAGASGYSWKSFWARVEGDYSPELRDLLAQYYERHLGDRKEWARVRSLRLCGRIIVPGEPAGASLEFTLLKRKPNACKMMMQRRGQVVYKAGYDGEDCWQLTPDGLESMAPAKAGEFICNASFTGYLLFPANVVLDELGGAAAAQAHRMAASLQINFASPALVTWQGHPCHALELDRPDGMRVRYYIDTETLLEHAHEVYTGDGVCIETVHMSDYRRLQGLLVPFQSETWQGDKRIQTIRVRSVQVNPGVTDWTFARPVDAAFSLYPKSRYDSPIVAERQRVVGPCVLPACPLASLDRLAPMLSMRSARRHYRPQVEPSPHPHRNSYIHFLHETMHEYNLN